ncbi:NADH-quinone oxidoreductase subunit N [Nitrosomonas communis]|uniref:NADH-quinone oxidoreductase subunit N n=1 Tax=Nitrosomonas communis TaxID=44574 RepID=A0A1H2TY16_9PROT|nr:NADH-quinone oxidoreductase subunit N [Nitrosomonas communis]SDW48671.1 NADH-quinone oxidoreductase subunit N [Nitrosomonas communis]
MPSAELINLVPYLVPTTGGLAILMLGIWPKRVSIRLLSTATLVFLLLGAAATLLWQVPGAIGSMLIIDDLSRVFTLFFMLGAAAIVMLSFGHAPIRNELQEEYLSLILFATLGMALLVSSNNLISAFLGLEILAVPLYALIAWQPTRYGAIEGGIKYAVLAGFATAFFLYGVALVYASSGTLDLTELNTVASDESLLPVAITLILVGIGFKVALVPFHMWAPDIYQAAPSPITALFASFSKAAAIVFLIRLLCLQLPQIWEALLPLLWGLALISMVVGNLLALNQQNLKRLLAYSSIAHLGYILVALAAGTAQGRDAAIYYAVALAIMNLGAFAVIVALTRREQDHENLADYRGLGRHYPMLGLAMGIYLLALAGLPPTAGFMAKLLAFGAAVEAGNMMLAIVAVLNTALAFFYYLRVMMEFYSEQETSLNIMPPTQGSLIVIIIAIVLVIGLGIFPQWLLGSLQLP